MAEAPGRGRSKRPVPLIVGAPVAPLFRFAVRWRNRRFDAGVGVWRAPAPVISVGNLSVGGVGKTPLVQSIARILIDAGRRPAILLRGYRAKPGEASDEEAIHRAALPNAAVEADPDRIATIWKLLSLSEAERPEVFLLDDGFQHRRLARDLDIVVIDATRDPWRDRLLPGGWLREPPSALRRADAVVLTHADEVDARACEELIGRIRAAHGREPIAHAAHAWDGLARHRNGETESAPVSALAGESVVAVCAIGNPDAFLTKLRAHGARLVETFVLRDHHDLGADAAARVAHAARDRGASMIVCTAKDWAKLTRRDVAWPCPVVQPQLRLDFLEGFEALESRVLQAAGTPAGVP